MVNTIVIGGGAAGMLAAYGAALSGDRVLLLEQNEKLGKKVYITGKGRCNVTNTATRDEIFSHIMRNPRFFYSAYAAFSNEDMMHLLEQFGIPVKVERGGRVFPQSDKSSDVLKGLARALHEEHVTVRLRCKVQEVTTRDGKVTGVRADGLQLPCDRAIVCTGGVSYPSTGSTGDGYAFAKEAGHTVIEPTPSLTPLQCSDSFLSELSGLSLRNVAVYTENGFKEQGELLFMPHGVTGPLILTLSAQPFSVQTLWIDLKPALDEATLDRRLQADFLDRKNKRFKNGFDGLLPHKLIPVFIECTGIDPELQLNQLTKEQRKQVAKWMKGFPLHVTGKSGMKQAVITRGGVKVQEVNPKTMESKKIKGLYFAGEVLDLDALTGGYNLQIAWSTGYLAGISGKEELT